MNINEQIFTRASQNYQNYFIKIANDQDLNPEIKTKTLKYLTKRSVSHLKSIDGYETLSGIKFGDRVYLDDGEISTLEEIDGLSLTLVDFTPRAV